jgi:hypothetical protein
MGQLSYGLGPLLIMGLKFRAAFDKQENKMSAGGW